jgi:hypothetical protein
VDDSSEWNRALRNSAVDALIEVAKWFNAGSMKYTWPRYLPGKAKVSGFFESFKDTLLRQMSSQNILESIDGQVCKFRECFFPCSHVSRISIPLECLGSSGLFRIGIETRRAFRYSLLSNTNSEDLQFVPPSTLMSYPTKFCDENGRPITATPKTSCRYLSSKYDSDDYETLTAIGVQEMVGYDFFRELQKLMKDNPAFFCNQSLEWHSYLARALAPLCLGKSDNLPFYLAHLGAELSPKLSRELCSCAP